MRRDVAVCELPGRERSHGGGVPSRQFSLIASWNERCETDLFAGTFAGSVPEPACISQLCVFVSQAEKPEKPHSRSVRGRLCETDSSYGDCESLQINLPQSRGLGHARIEPKRDDEHAQLRAMAELRNIQL